MVAGYVHPDFTAVADVFRRQLPVDRPGGGAVCVYYRGVPVVDMYGGTRDRDGTAWTRDTLSLSFSTTKGIIATLLHQLADRGLLDYDQPVARYWPEFAQNGKARITVRHLLCHEAGLYALRPLVGDAAEMRDWPHMLRLMEQAAPVHHPGRQNGYHALTFGWLVGGLVEKISGQPLATTLADNLAAPLALDGCHIGVPDSALTRCAQLMMRPPKPPRPAGSPPPPKRPLPLPQRLVETGLRLTGFEPESTEAAMVPKGMARFDWNAKQTVQACIPGAGGMFSAASLARIYAALGNGGELDGARLLSAATVQKMATVQNTARGAVIPVPMRWRLGYHRVFTTGPRTPQAFGHFGYGGSGAWCDPSRGLAVGYVVNYGIGTPFGDMRLWQINSAVIRAAEKVETRRPVFVSA
ncbi:MAG: serine hydrolase domain-containing protein [Moraxellaceae bacterium]|nr:serine hydrolase domain-containing protein [Moraxellaceae bacterium]